MAEDLNISSLVVRVRPEFMEQVMQAIAALPGAEIHASDPVGKIVVVLEAAGDAALSEEIERIHAMSGVLSASMVFHHVEGKPEGASESPTTVI